jgi:hypothetical protein
MHITLKELRTLMSKVEEDETVKDRVECEGTEESVMINVVRINSELIFQVIF